MRWQAKKTYLKLYAVIPLCLEPHGTVGIGPGLAGPNKRGGRNGGRRGKMGIRVRGEKLSPVCLNI